MHNFIWTEIPGPLHLLQSKWQTDFVVLKNIFIGFHMEMSFIL